MKKLALIVVLSMSFLTGYGQNRPLRVITYNIMDGFDWGKDSVRQAKTAGWLKSQHPDVVALQELCGYTNARLEKEASQWGHAYTVLLKTTGYSVGLSANQPIQVVERKTEGLWHGMLHCIVNGIHVFVVHFSPDDYQYRGDEADTIIQRVNKVLALNQHCLVLGDFNSLSPFDDDITKSRPLVLQRDSIGDVKSSKYKNLNHNYFDYSVIGKFLSVPLIDVCQKYVPAKVRFTYGTPALIPRYRKSIQEVVERQYRLDYIFASSELASRCTRAFIANGEETGYLSDHYPVIADFEVRW